jgi:hypothetical protein
MGCVLVIDYFSIDYRWNMKYFLAKANVRQYAYMGEHTTSEDIRLVVAENAVEAWAKYEAYWENKSVEYSITYYVSGFIEDTIE